VKRTEDQVFEKDRLSLLGYIKTHIIWLSRFKPTFKVATKEECDHLNNNSTIDDIKKFSTKNYKLLRTFSANNSNIIWTILNIQPIQTQKEDKLELIKRLMDEKKLNYAIGIDPGVIYTVCGSSINLDRINTNKLYKDQMYADLNFKVSKKYMNSVSGMDQYRHSIPLLTFLGIYFFWSGLIYFFKHW